MFLEIAYFFDCRLKIAFKWLMRAFSGFLASDQVLLLWDRILSFDSLEILPGQSETFCILLVSDSPERAWAHVMIIWPSAHPSTERKTPFSWTLGMSLMSSFALWYYGIFADRSVFSGFDLKSQLQ